MALLTDTKVSTVAVEVAVAEGVRPPVGIECALGHVTGVYFYKNVALINPPYWIYLYCSKRIIQ